MPSISELRQMSHIYFYTPNAKVFHTKECHVLQRVQEVMGCQRYKTAVRHRRPCKICCPTEQAYTKHKSMQEVITARLFDGSVINICRGRIVGCCHHRIHPGKMTKRLLLEHDCIGKQCRFFEKYEDANYWEGLEEKKQHKAKLKKKKSALRKAEQIREERQQAVGEEVQYYLDLCGYEADVIEVKEETPTCFRVFYVSDKTYNDWREFSEFYGIMGHMHPDWRLLMRHIRDEQGRYVTIDEFYERKQAQRQ